MPRRSYEKYALSTSLATYLQGKGWSITEVRRGFQSDVPITVPTVSVYFLPSSFYELEISRDKPHFTRDVQIDAYMEDEARAESIGDDIGDFFDTEMVEVLDPDSNLIAILQCLDSETISMDTLPPHMTDSKNRRWREVVRVTVEVDYLV